MKITFDDKYSIRYMNQSEYKYLSDNNKVNSNDVYYCTDSNNLYIGYEFIIDDFKCDLEKFALLSKRKFMKQL